MRCAHRNGLLDVGAGARDRAARGVRADGSVAQRRGRRRRFRYVAGKRAGTEVYDASDDDDDEGSGELDIRPSGPLSIHSIAARAKSPTKPPASRRRSCRRRFRCARRPRSRSFSGMELTSIINMIDVDQARREAARRSRASAPPLDARLGPAVARHRDRTRCRSRNHGSAATAAPPIADAADADAAVAAHAPPPPRSRCRRGATRAPAPRPASVCRRRRRRTCDLRSATARRRPRGARCGRGS